MNFGSFCGLQVIEDPNMTALHTVRNERKWCHRKRFQPHRAYNYIHTKIPSDEIYHVGDKIYAHPEIAKRIREAAINPATAYSMGAHFAENDIQGKPTKVDRGMMNGFAARAQSFSIAINKPNDIINIRGTV